MKKNLTYLALLIGIVSIVGGSIAFANTPEKNQEGLHPMFQRGMEGDQRFQGVKGMEGMLEDKAAIFGLSVDDIKARLESGETFIEISEEQGIDMEAVHEEMKSLRLERIKDHLNQLVEGGEITQEQADEKLQFMEDNGGKPFHGYMSKKYFRHNK